MDEWQKDFSDVVKSVSDEVERFFVGMTEVVDSFIEMTEELSEQVQSSLLSESRSIFTRFSRTVFGSLLGF